MCTGLLSAVVLGSEVWHGGCRLRQRFSGPIAFVVMPVERLGVGLGVVTDVAQRTKRVMRHVTSLGIIRSLPMSTKTATTKVAVLTQAHEGAIGCRLESRGIEPPPVD